MRYLYFIVIFFLVGSGARFVPSSNGNTVFKGGNSDKKSTIQGNLESVNVVLGGNIWMRLNLDTDTFRDGTKIKQAQSVEEWQQAMFYHQPAWCYTEVKMPTGVFAGKLYNVYAISHPKGLAPEGWHIPDKEEWYSLAPYAGTDQSALRSEKMWPKECKGSNTTGFSALPLGGRKSDGTFHSIGADAFWWTMDQSFVNFTCLNSAMTSAESSEKGHKLSLKFAGKNQLTPTEEQNPRKHSVSELHPIEAYNWNALKPLDEFTETQLSGMFVRCVHDK